MLPIGSKFPANFDDDSNLLVAKDSLKLRLGQDYNPGDRGVLAESSVEGFPPTGVITLIDHCNPDHVTSFYYGSRKDNAFTNLELTPGSADAFKSRLSSVVTQQLDALHHNNIAASVMAIQECLGTAKDDNDKTLFGRLNRLKRVAFAPRAWFEADVTMGLAPLTVTLTSYSTGVEGPVGPVSYAWDCGDGTRVNTRDDSIVKTYTEPGIYTVTLEITNLYGTDRVTLQNVIKVKSPAPDVAKVNILPQPGQSLMRDSLRTTINQFVLLEVPQGENPDNPNVSFGGETLNLDTKKPVDPIVSYTWQTATGDVHRSSNQTKAIYDAGGLYDLSLRVDTKLGSFRISHFPKMIDVIEPTNLWLWLFQSPKSVAAYEYGLLSETFKAKQYNVLSLLSNDSFLDGVPNEAMQKEEFKHNNLFIRRGTAPSGFEGEGMLLWASGRDQNESSSLEKVMGSSFNAFLDMYSTPYEVTERPWNWAGFASSAKAYLIGGSRLAEQNPGLSQANDTKSVIDFNTMEATTVKLHHHNYGNGAHDLKLHATDFDEDGEAIFGHFSRYRTTWKGDVGYMVRSGGPGDDYQLKSFYKTEGTIGEPFINITKLLDLPEPKSEGQLLSLNDIVCFLSDNGDVFGYNENTNTWEVGETHATLFSHTGSGKFLAASDKDRRAYISFGNDAFVKYNASDSTFTTLGNRPTGDQWLLDVF